MTKKKYAVIFHKRAAKDLKYVHPRFQDSIMNAVLNLGKNPRPDGYLKLKGYDDLFRIRVADYRVIYTIQDDKLIVLVLEVCDRKDVYKH